MSTHHLLVPGLAFALLACGGTVVYDEDTSSSGDGGASAQSGSTGKGGASTSGSTSNSTGGIPTSATGTGSSQGGGSSTSTTVGPGSTVTVGPGSGGGSSCGDLSYAECLGAVDRCVPEFDDRCCSSCFPGECSDCVDFQAVGCVDRLEGSQCGAVSCGFVPAWACNGDKPDCSNGCFGEPGCVEKEECFGDGCGITCDAVAPDACGPVNCNAPPPQCFDGQLPEAANGCWTGLCIPSWVCQFTF